jgi:hypothetical protein
VLCAEEALLVVNIFLTYSRGSTRIQFSFNDRLIPGTTSRTIGLPFGDLIVKLCRILETIKNMFWRANVSPAHSLLPAINQNFQFVIVYIETKIIDHMPKN